MTVRTEHESQIAPEPHSSLPYRPIGHAPYLCRAESLSRLEPADGFFDSVDAGSGPLGRVNPPEVLLLG